MSKIVFVQREVSQLDEPVYSRMFELDPSSVSVVYWNDYGLVRTMPDPETGVVPQFEGHPKMARTIWVDSRISGVWQLIHAVMALEPALVVLSDIDTITRTVIAARLRMAGLRVALRSDKNHLSNTANAGVKRWLERTVIRGVYDTLAPVSRLTSEYYEWPDDKPCIEFPYSTDERKFSPRCEVVYAARKRIRDHLGIPDERFVFLSAAKFVDRENQWGVIRSFERATMSLGSQIHLVALGDGPQLPAVKEYCSDRGVVNASFPGFVAFSVLQDYFFSCDAFVHLAEVGPWEVSPQDALVSGRPIIVSDKVGSGKVLLRGQCQRFAVPFNDECAASLCMEELARQPKSVHLFDEACLATSDYTVGAVAKRLIDAV